MDLHADPNREHLPETGIYVRAKRDLRWDSVDISHLGKDSLLIWLRSRGGRNPLAEDTVGILLDHGHLTTPEEK